VRACAGRFWAQSTQQRQFEMGRFSKKNKKVLTKFPGLATSGRHNSAIIKNDENSQPNGPPMGCLVSILSLESI